MTTFDFKLVLDQVEIDEAKADALYDRCKDGTLITAGGVTYMDFDRQADSLDQAVRSAIADVNGAGFRVVRVEIEAGGVRNAVDFDEFVSEYRADDMRNGSE